MYLSFKFFTAHPEMMNEGSPPALPEVIESLPKVKLTKEQVGKSWLCLLRWPGNSFSLSFHLFSFIICSKAHKVWMRGQSLISLV